MLQLKNIKKDYLLNDSKVEALKNVNLNFRENEFVSILGPSGCGKTTLLNIIGGLDRYTNGDLFINGKSTKDFKDKDWDAYRNKSIGFVFQNYNLIPHLSVIGNVELALTISGISFEERRKRAKKVLEDVGLATQIYKKPNQLSGGQMQRVAIARALVNDPDILLADEPTGALDSATSVQIMEILKTISKDRLIIMVTHNSDLANKYSTRVINLLDGEVTNDSNSYKKDEDVIEKFKKERTSMSFITALSLSFKNLISKKARTILTAFAGSIGIIGIALVLALSNGFNKYIEKMQADMLSSYPLVIDRTTIDFDARRQNFMQEEVEDNSYIDDEIIYVDKVFEENQSEIIRNNLSEEYIENVIEKIPEDLHYGIKYAYGIHLNMYVQDEDEYKQINSSTRMGTIYEEIINNNEFISTQYDVLKGELPTEYNHIVIIVDEYNKISDYSLSALGLYDFYSEEETLTFDDLLNLKIRLLKNDLIYIFDGEKFSGKDIDNSLFLSGLELEITGIIRPHENTQSGSISSAIGYTSALTDFILDLESESQIVSWMNDNQNLNPFSDNHLFELNPFETAENKYNSLMEELGGSKQVTGIRIFPVDFDAKEQIKSILNDYNKTALEENRVYYTDIMEIIFETMNTAINSISYILIAFTAISLVVSSIMIGIITYVSVIERTKEIGVLRSIGARKKDISRVFNAETFIIGLSAGVFGIIVSLILSFPINKLISNLVDDIGNVAQLTFYHALILIIVSTLLTLFSGLIPSRIAAKKDPVVALRTE